MGVYLHDAKITGYYQQTRFTAARIAHSKYRSKCKGEARNTPRVISRLPLQLSKLPLKKRNAYIS